jgi:ethanolamine utilization protein EutQ (cupin superfamily)
MIEEESKQWEVEMSASLVNGNMEALLSIPESYMEWVCEGFTKYLGSVERSGMMDVVDLPSVRLSRKQLEKSHDFNRDLMRHVFPMMNRLALGYMEMRQQTPPGSEGN